MNTFKKAAACLLIGSLLHNTTLKAQEMDKMWGANTEVKKGETGQKSLFEWGNYAMFIHWGLYSQLGNQWKGKTFYGIGEWMMNENMAAIPINEYKNIAKDFNPVEFNAKAIAQLAKDAGMKYIIITSKHHDGFAMYNSKVNDFNIVKQTPFARDPMKELSDACRELGLGFGFYYSHNQDWTYPGGNGGPTKNANGEAKDFDSYYQEKCLPQVEEITKNYGDIELIWFDTPGGMPEKYAKELVEVVHRNQPNALVSGRVGYNLGDYQTLGDMEVPLENVDGLWESIDVTNDSWGFAWYDQNWKTPKQLISYLISTVARGGTYMMNIGLDGKGRIPQQAAMTLRSAGKWIQKHPQVVYGAAASPWKHALPWGDATINNGKLYLSVYSWPTNGKLYLPGVTSEINSIKLLNGKQSRKLNFQKEGNWITIETANATPDPLVSVIEITSKNNLFAVDPTAMGVDPEQGVQISTLFAAVTNEAAYNKHWMEKFGEWKAAYVVEGWKDNVSVTWEIDIKEPGMYQTELKYAGNGRLVWSIESEEGEKIKNQQNASPIYATHPIGWMKFAKAGKHKLTVRLLEGKREGASLMALGVSPILF